MHDLRSKRIDLGGAMEVCKISIRILRN